jgi:hypothetical protein
MSLRVWPDSYRIMGYEGRIKEIGRGRPYG